MVSRPSLRLVGGRGIGLFDDGAAARNVIDDLLGKGLVDGGAPDHAGIIVDDPTAPSGRGQRVRIWRKAAPEEERQDQAESADDDENNADSRGIDADERVVDGKCEDGADRDEDETETDTHWSTSEER